MNDGQSTDVSRLDLNSLTPAELVALIDGACVTIEARLDKIEARLGRIEHVQAYSGTVIVRKDAD